MSIHKLRMAKEQKSKSAGNNSTNKKISPAAQVLIDQYELDPNDLTGTGAGGSITKADVIRYVETISEEE